MSNKVHYRRWWSTTVWALLPFLLLLGSGPACSSSSSGPTSPSGPFVLTFSLDASFQDPHGGQPISIAVIRTVDGFVVANGNATVSATENPSYSFGPVPGLERGMDYEVHYWIDSNIRGGTLGVCDPKAIDHQWSVEFLSVAGDIDWIASHNDALTEDVCGTFV